MIYAYCRVSTPHQRLERQITNISSLYPKAQIFREHFTGTTQSRPVWDKLINQVQKGDTIIFDSVSRMSRNAAEGFQVYKKLYEMRISLIFLNEPLINTSVYENSKSNLLSINIETGNQAVDEFFKGNVRLINDFLMALAEEQIKAAFDQAEKEVTDLHSRISQGMREAKKNGVKIGIPKGTSLTTKKSLSCKSIILKHLYYFIFIILSYCFFIFFMAFILFLSILCTRKFRYSYEKTVFFCGDAKKHQDYDKIYDFCSACGYEIISLSDEPLYDVGTIFFF